MYRISFGPEGLSQCIECSKKLSLLKSSEIWKRVSRRVLTAHCSALAWAGFRAGFPGPLGRAMAFRVLTTQATA